MSNAESKTIDNDDILFTPHSSTFSGIQQSLFCLDASMIKLRIQRAELNKKINDPICSYFEKSQFRRELKDVTKLIGKKIFRQRDFTSPEIDMLIREFKTWLNEPLFLTFYDTEKERFYFHRASKRGNSIYRNQVKETLASRTEFFEDPNFDKLLIREEEIIGWRKKKMLTNTMFITLTWNPNIFLGNKKRAWLCLSYFYHKFIARFRKKHGRCWVLRGVESTENGFPHIHLLLICENSFVAFKPKKRKCPKCKKYFETLSQKDKISCPYCQSKMAHPFRVQEKTEIQKMWNSHIDIVAPSDIHSVKDYVVKDILKQYDRRKERRTEQDYLSLALCWLFRKQSYAISGFDHDLISVGIIETQVEKILSSKEGKNLVYEGMIKLDFAIPYLKHLKGKPPPDIFSVELTEEQKDSLNCHITCRPNKDLDLRKQHQAQKIQILIEKYKFNQEIADVIKIQQKIQEEKRFSRFCKLESGEKIKKSDLDLTDRLNLLAFGVA